MIQVCLLLIGFSIIDLLYADLRFVDAIPVTIKYGEKYLAFDSISRHAQCSDLIPLLELRLGSKVPRNARLMVNGRFLIMHETIDEAGLIGHSSIEVSVPIRGGMVAEISPLMIACAADLKSSGGMVAEVSPR